MEWRRADADNRRHDHEHDQRHEAAHHEHVAVGEVHHADDAEDHRIADRDEAVDRPQRQPVDELLEKYFHWL